MTRQVSSPPTSSTVVATLAMASSRDRQEASTAPPPPTPGWKGSDPPTTYATGGHDAKGYKGGNGNGKDDGGGEEDRNRDWKRVLSTMNDLILFKTKADALTWRDAFENMDIYLARIGLSQGDLDRMSIIHVAGTKGKGSTCAMVESILRSCGYTTGLYTSPHLIDIRERVRVNGEMVDKETFRSHFWRCLDQFKAAATPEAGVPGYFRFLTLLALSIFHSKKTDVTILEVGIGGRLDATNLVKHPTVTGITSLGMDHMEMLGDTLGKIAREKAGIMKRDRPSFSVLQEEEAVEVLKVCASEHGAATFEFVPPLDGSLVNVDGSKPTTSLGGAHMSVNAGLAVKLASEWERISEPGRASPGSVARLAALSRGILPAEYSAGLRAVEWPGRSQIIHDSHHSSEVADGQRGISVVEGTGGEPRPPACSSSIRQQGNLSFYIDGAHTPESMVTCAAWFASEVMGGEEEEGASAPSPSPSALLTSSMPLVASASASPPEVRRILLFNCMKERDPSVLLPSLSRVLAARGVDFHHALFVPSESLYGVLPSSPPSSSSPSVPTTTAAGDASKGGAAVASSAQASIMADARAAVEVALRTPLPDLSWQAGMQSLWEKEELGTSSSPGHTQHHTLPPLPHATSPPDSGGVMASSLWRSAVVPSLPMAIDWLRKCSRSGVDVQVLVTGSLYLVGDVLRLLGRAPK